METYSPHALYATIERNKLGWNVSIHRVAGDWNKAAQ
jgi:hypothetical protein